jgi:hypothetical protein
MAVYVAKDSHGRTITTVVAPNAEQARQEICRKFSLTMSLHNLNEWIAAGERIEESAYDPHQHEPDDLEVSMDAQWR